MKLSASRIVFYLGAAVVLVIVGLAGRMVLSPGTASVSVTSDVSLATVGGPFTLVDHGGKTVTDADFRGRFMLIYFGFTYCPDACPTSLTAITDALGILGGDAKRMAPIFISIDPARDTPEHLSMYVRHFHPDLVALTGTEDQVAAAARAYRVYYAKVREKGAAEDDYSMDHTAIIYLMGPDGKFRLHFTGHATSPETMARRIREFL